MTTHAPDYAFPITRWSVVLQAAAGESPGAAAALDAICTSYWYPLYAYIRRCGQSPHDAEDLTQEFFRLLLAKRWLAAADPGKGRLRTFLLTALKRFMAKEWRHASAQKRGGGSIHVPMDTTVAESRYATDPAPQLDADAAFDRQWALTLLDLALERLQAEFAAASKVAELDALKDWLGAARGTIDYPAIATRLGISPEAARVAVHRMRKRFRALYREEILQTLAPGTSADEELRHLAGALARE